MDQASGPITAVVTRDVFPGRERDYEEWAHRVVSASTRYGARGHTFLTPNAGAPTRRVLIAQFPDQDAVTAWDESQDRDRLVREAAEFSSLAIQRASGLEAWFTLPGEQAIVPPPRWKQLLVTSWGLTHSWSCYRPSSCRSWRTGRSCCVQPCSLWCYSP
jgi:antibiotic biosynthesis monooxygenase (ABM) superfamily enzyme